MIQDSPRILYIEDNPLNMTLIRKSIHFMGYRLLEAINGKQGFDIAVAQRPDLILMDLNLPDMSGTEIAAQLRRNLLTCATAIVALTSDKVDDPEKWCQANGFDSFLTKPVNRSTLMETVRYWVGKAQQRHLELVQTNGSRSGAMFQRSDAKNTKTSGHIREMTYLYRAGHRND